jgi:hypothetical protein
VELGCAIEYESAHERECNERDSLAEMMSKSRLDTSGDVRELKKDESEVEHSRSGLCNIAELDCPEEGDHSTKA